MQKWSFPKLESIFHGFSPILGLFSGDLNKGLSWRHICTVRRFKFILKKVFGAIRSPKFWTLFSVICHNCLNWPIFVLWHSLRHFFNSFFIHYYFYVSSHLFNYTTLKLTLEMHFKSNMQLFLVLINVTILLCKWMDWVASKSAFKRTYKSKKGKNWIRRMQYFQGFKFLNWNYRDVLMLK